MILNKLQTIEKTINSELSSKIKDSTIKYNELLIETYEKDLIDVVQFLKQIDIESDEQMAYEDTSFDVNVENTYPKQKIDKLKTLLDEFMDKKEELKEFEEELKKHKNELTPGQMGDA